MDDATGLRGAAIATLTLEVARQAEALERARTRRAALLDLADRLRALDDPDAMARLAADLLARELGASRAALDLAGDVDGSRLGALAGALGEGRAVAIADTGADPRTDGDAGAARAVLHVPLLEAGRLAALASAERAEPRAWSEDDVALAREILTCARAAVGQRRAEAEARRLAAALGATEAARTLERDGVWRVSRDLLGIADADSVWRSINPAWTRALGWSIDAFVGRNSAWLLHPDDLAPAQARRDALAAGREVTFEGRYRTRAGDYRLLSWTAVPFEGRIYSVARDVTEERAREAALRDSQDFARLALQSVGGVGVWTYEVATDRFTCDAAISELYGLDAAEGASGIRRERFLANVHPADMPRLRATMAGGLERESDLELEYRLVHPGGVTRWVMSRGHTYFDEAGRPVRRTGVGIETTKQRELADQLRQSQKMEAVGQLTGGLAHDFNNLLAGISGALDLMQKRLAQGRPGEIGRYLDAAQGASRRAAALTHRLLAFSRQQTLDPKPTDVARLIGGLMDLIRRTVGPAVTVETGGPPGPWMALVDPNQLENALLNLCINARDAMPDGGRIRVEVGEGAIGPEADRDLPAGRYLSISVRDTGTGMPPEVIARAFDPFFTTKPLGKGTGLGLSMIYGFARQSGGQVRIASEVGCGTAVFIDLPRHDGDAAGLEVAGGGAAPGAGEGETVLVVDDEPTIRMLVGEVLADFGYAAREAEDGPTGLAVLMSTARIDLLVTDVGLPNGMNGRQLADAARVTRPGLKVLFITGYAEHAAVGNGHLEPGMAVLTKPFAMDDLVRKIQEIMAT